MAYTHLPITLHIYRLFCLMTQLTTNQKKARRKAPIIFTNMISAYTREPSQVDQTDAMNRLIPIRKDEELLQLRLVLHCCLMWNFAICGFFPRPLFIFALEVRRSSEATGQARDWTLDAEKGSASSALSLTDPDAQP